jgi:hypothetical protein
MKIVDMQAHIKHCGCDLSYNRVRQLLDTKKKTALQTAYLLNKSFPQTSIDFWVDAKPKDVVLFFEQISGKKIGNVPSVKNKRKRRRIKKLSRMGKKYGIDIFSDLKAVKNNPYIPLTHVANKYGITREYAAQLYKTVYGNRYYEDSQKATIERETTCLNNPKRKVADWSKGSLLFKGAIAEKLFVCECEKRNIPVSIPCKAEIDLLINGFRVDVKSSWEKKTNKSYRFSICEKQLNDCDFFACYAAEIGDFYIIPNKNKGKNKQKTKMIYVPTTRNRNFKKQLFEKYLNNFDQFLIANK